MENKVFYVRRIAMIEGQLTDLGAVPIPEDHLDETMRRNPLWTMIEGGGPQEITGIDAPEFKEDKNDAECPICGKTFKHRGSLNLHKRKHL